jgi:hypothetical protein
VRLVAAISSGRDPLGDVEWESLARTDETATFFQTPVWHKFAEDFEGTRTVCLRLVGDERDDAVAILPVQQRRRWWGAILTSPFGTYSSLLRGKGWDAKQDPDQSVMLQRELSRLNLSLPGSPFDPVLAEAWTGVARPEFHTHVLRLEAFDPVAWVERWSRNHRRLLKTAQETGFTVRLAESPADIAAYCALNRAQAARWGAAARRAYPDELFQEAYLRFAPSGSMKLWLAEGPEGIAAGRLCLYHGFHAVEWHAAAETNAMHKGVNHLLVQAVVSRAHAAGHKVYDFNPNPGLEAVDHFKRGFATEALPFRGIHHRAGTAGAVLRLLKRIQPAR